MRLFKNKTPIDDLCQVLNDYMHKSDIDDIFDAYQVAASAHEGQYRRSGEPFVFHPVSVAMILAELQLDSDCIIAALLHDCIEDTKLSEDDIANQFGGDVAHIVQGVSKLTGLEFHSNIDRQAQNFRKLFLAMSADMRVIIIKLADRLHNMRTLKSMPRDKQMSIAAETVDIHAQIARRLGLNSIKVELDNLCFEIIHPFRHQILTKQIKKQCGGNRKKVIKRIEKEINIRLKQEGLPKVEIEGRSKQPFSIYQKMQDKHLKFSEVLDMYGFRVIVDDVPECYKALGIIHNLYKPLPGKFKDYIALPKSNGYQSLHTVVFGPNKIFIEVQVRSKDMHFISEYGIAAHWHYKSDTKDSVVASNWLGSLLDIGQNSNSAAQFLEETRTDLLASEVFVFTPEGDIIQLPYESSVLDFAYAVHTNIGNKTVRAKVDKIITPLNQKLKSGQTIEIITDKNARPHPSWLQTAITAKARSSIKAYLKAKSVTELVQLGDYLLNNALDYQNIATKNLSDDKWQACLDELKCESKDELYMKIGLSEIFVSVVLNKLDPQSQDLSKKVVIRESKNKSSTQAQCCHPIPGDAVAAILTTTKGLVMHRVNCGNFIHAKQKNAQWLQIDWQPEKAQIFEVLISVNVENRRGILAAVANAIAKMDTNIEHFEVQEKDNLIKALNFIITVPSTTKLTQIFTVLKALKFVKSVERL